MQPPRKRHHARAGPSQGSNGGSAVGSANRSDLSPSSGSSSSSDGASIFGSKNDLGEDFFAELDDWLATCDDSLVLPPRDADSPPLAGTEASLSDSRLPKQARKTPKESASTARRASLARAKPKSSTQRQKEELAYLRAKSGKLEMQLQRLRQDRLRPARALIGARDGSTSSEGVWESIAVHQQEARFDAEKERARLQTMLKAQIQFARSLEKLLCKPKVWDQLQETNWAKRAHATKSDAEIFDELLQSVNARAGLVEAILDAKELNKSPNDVRINSASPDGICVESRLSKVIPFDFHLTVDVLWRCFRQGKIAMLDTPYEVVEHSDDVMFIKVTVERPPVLAHPVTAYRVVKRFVGVDSVHIVAEIALTSKESPGSAIPSSQIINQGWGRLTSVKLADGTTGTQIQGFISSVITVLEPEGDVDPCKQEAEPRHFEIDLLSELIVSAFQEKKMLVQREFESVLLDATLARTGSSS